MSNAEFQAKCDRFVQNNVLLCVSGTVSMLVERDFDGQEDIWNASHEATVCSECNGDGYVNLTEECDQCDEGHSGEVYEYWAVDRHFARELREHGEGCFDGDVIGLAGCDVWCRTTTGQAISIDHVVETIVRKVMR